MLKIGIIITVVSIIITLFTSGKQVKFVRWAILLTMLLQLFTLTIVPGLSDHKSSLLFLVAGLGIGILSAARTKLTNEAKLVYYKQGRLFSVLYLLTMLVSQLLAAAARQYLPIFLYATALAAGLQLGFELGLVLKHSRIKKANGMKTLLMLIIASTILAFSAPPVHASQIQGWTDGEWKVDYQLTATYFFNDDMTKNSISNFPKVQEVLKASNVSIKKGQTIPATFEIKKSNFLYKFDVNIIGNQYSEQEKSSFDIIAGSVKVFAVGVQVKGVMTSDAYYIMNYSAYRKAAGSSGSSSGGSSSGSSKPAAPKEPGKNVKDDSNWLEDLFDGIPLTKDEADSIDFGGVLIGISGLISAFTGLIPKGLLMTNTVPTTTQGTPPAPSSGRPPKPPIPPQKPAPAAPAVNKSQATVGMRRADGTVWTKNHGWQNEDFPGLQMNSLKASVQKLEAQVKQHALSGDSLREGIAKDMLAEEQRKLRSWSEDSAAISRAKSLRNEADQQKYKDKLNQYADDMESYSNYASGISFAGDIAMAVATSGASSVYSGVKSFSALRGAVKTVKQISAAKEFIASTANVINSVSNENKSIIRAFAEEAINRKIGKVAGEQYKKAFTGMGYTKVGSNAYDSCKALVSAGETSASNIAQAAVKETAEEAKGLYNNYVNQRANAVQGGR